MKLVFTILFVIAAAASAAPSYNVSSRIVGGTVAIEGDFPYLVSVQYQSTHNCGGSILDENTILTAAHCVIGRPLNTLIVLAGTTRLNTGGLKFKVKSIKIHENYDIQNIKNDIAIIKLETPIKFHTMAQPIELRKTYIDGNEWCTLSGWGTWREGSAMSVFQEYIDLKTLDFEDCREKQTSRPVVESEVCTLTKKGEGACHGDSGGPLVDSKGELFGIASWTTPCGRGVPDVFVRISSYLDWIEANRN